MKRKFSTLNRYGKSEHSKAVRKLDAALSILIRKRDKEIGCVTCGRKGVPLDCGHFRRRECMATRFDYRNVAGQCLKDNRFDGGKPYEFALEIDKRYGRGTSKALYRRSQEIWQWEVSELEQLTSSAKHSFMAYQQLYDSLAREKAKK